MSSRKIAITLFRQTKALQGYEFIPTIQFALYILNHKINFVWL